MMKQILTFIKCMQSQKLCLNSNIYSFGFLIFSVLGLINVYIYSYYFKQKSGLKCSKN